MRYWWVKNKKIYIISGLSRRDFWQPLIAPEARSCQSFSALHIGVRADQPLRTAFFRPSKADVFSLLEVLRFPDKFVCSQRTVCSKLEGLCILLKRLAFPCRHIDMVSRFGRNPTELCLIFNTVLEFVYSSHHHHLESWNQPFLLAQVLGAMHKSSTTEVLLSRTSSALLMGRFVEKRGLKIIKKLFTMAISVYTE